MQGSHVGYSRVEEEVAGKTVYYYRNTPIGNEYEDYRNGDLLRQEVYDSSNRMLSKTENRYDADTTYSWSSLNRKAFNGFVVEALPAQDNRTILCRTSASAYTYTWRLPCCNPGPPVTCSQSYTAKSKWQKKYYFVRANWKYQVRSTETQYYYRTVSGVVKTDSVTQVTKQRYSNAEVTQPTEVVTTNSDGREYKIVTKFAQELNNTTLIGFGIVGVPLVQETYAGSTQVAGTKTEYSLFDDYGNPTPSGNKPYPYKFYNYEMTWTNGSPTPGAWALKGTVKTIYASTGLIKSMRKEGEAYDELYEWESGQVKKRTFNAFVWEYSYYASSRLLYTIKDIDGQVTTFKYDGLMRLDSVLARGGNVKTKYQYQYKDASNPRNFVRSSTTFTPVSGSNIAQQQTWEYLDGLGRPIQTVRWQHQPTRGANDQVFGKVDIVTAQEYDPYGRVVKNYVPYQSAYDNGAYVPVTGGTPYALTQYETSPLSRVTSVTPPGGYATTTAYGANTAALSIPGTSITYAAGSLFETRNTDPDGRASLTYTDKRGRLVLSRVPSGSINLDTYYQYDDKDRLIRVIPPGAMATSANLIYTYEYDAADRLIKKKVPDMGPVYMKYNTRDLLVFLRDSNLEATNQCLGYKYDAYGRIVESGLVAGFPSDPNAAFTFAESQIRNYYDGFDGSTQLSLTTFPQYMGRMRRTESRVLGTTGGGTWLHSTYAYDSYGRTTQVVGNNYLNTASTTAESIVNTYDYADNLLTTTRTHQPGSGAATGNQTIKFTKQYDHQGRPINYLMDLNAAGTHLAEYNYDFRERLIERNLHAGLYGSTWGWLQSVDYTYNNQDWLTAINSKNATGTSLALSATCSPSMPSPGSTPLVKHPEDNDLFYLELRYDQLFTTTSPAGGTISGLIGTLQKGGNIAQLAWRVRGRERQAYSFTYDTLSRMKTASYFDVNTSGTATASSRFNEALTYDQRGNINTLQRQGFIQSTCNFGQIDNLTYSYAAGTNRLTSVADASGKTEGFKPGSGTGYSYDGNGNLKSDSYKGISDISYNHLNLPRLITFSSGGTIEIVYDATGNKLRKIVKAGATVLSEQDYVGGLEYRKTGTGSRRIEAIYHEEGRFYNLNVDASNTPSWRKEYTLRDHLGNARITFADKNGNGIVEVTSSAATNEILQENHYYPFGLNYGGPYWMNDAARDNGYTYNSKELNTDFGLNWLDYGARWYDASIGRWCAVDPLAEEYASWSPYNYVLNNPINAIDPNGMYVIAKDKESQQYILGYLNDILGKGHGFSFKKNGALIFKEKDISGTKDYDPDQRSIFDSVKEVVNDENTTIYAKISEDEKINIDIKTPDGKLSYKADLMSKTSDGDYQAGQFEEIPGSFLGQGYAVLVVNRKEAATNVSDAGNNEKTSPCESCVFIHELLDHGFYFVKTGIGEPPAGSSKRDEVWYQNKALRIKGSKTRTGLDHGVKK
ncbi:MAG: hypothetical protein H6555_12945 [Lewinellaceae bacterium]|nr:hypothetical protein [Lewinellaceae bacterium]